MWNKCGMSRNETDLKQAISDIKNLRDDFYKNVNVSLCIYCLYIKRFFNHVFRHDLGDSNYMFNKYSSSSYLSKYNKMKT